MPIAPYPWSVIEIAEAARHLRTHGWTREEVQLLLAGARDQNVPSIRRWILDFDGDELREWAEAENLSNALARGYEDDLLTETRAWAS